MTTALEGGEWSAARPGRTLPPGKTRYPLYRRLVESQGRSGRAENLVPLGFDPRTVQPVAQSLYRLNYPAHSYLLHFEQLYCRQLYGWGIAISWNNCDVSAVLPVTHISGSQFLFPPWHARTASSTYCDILSREYKQFQWRKNKQV